jgi:lysozyme
MTKINEEGMRIIRESEGRSLSVYLCPAGKKTVGFGHVDESMRVGDTITEEVAERLLEQDIRQFEEIVERNVRVRLNENQFSALVSFTFNVGPGKIGVKDGFVTLKSGRTSTMLSRINMGQFIQAAEEFPKWVSAGGRQLPGLVTRRAKERALFLKPVIVKG